MISDLFLLRVARRQTIRPGRKFDMVARGKSNICTPNDGQSALVQYAIEHHAARDHTVLASSLAATYGHRDTSDVLVTGQLSRS
jgi:hypothetical protein